MAHLAARTGLTTCMGNQIHSQQEYRTATAVVHEGLIGIRIGPSQAVIHMPERELEAKAFSHLLKGREERDRIDAPGYGDQDATVPEPQAGHGLGDAPEHHPLMI